MRGKALLLQARYPDDPAKEHERRCFVDAMALAHERLVCYDLLEGPPPLESVLECDALFMGGSGDFYVSKGDLPHHDALLELLRGVVDVGHPTFASCFGYQMLVEALGGTIEHAPDKTEVGTYEVVLTAEGRTDELFGDLPARFFAQMGHKDRATVHPEGVPNLAATELSPMQALRIPGKPIWATQFHPELDRDTNLDRYERYLDSYAQHLSEAERAEARQRFRESPEASGLLLKFLKKVTS